MLAALFITAPAPPLPTRLPIRRSERGGGKDTYILHIPCTDQQMINITLVGFRPPPERGQYAVLKFGGSSVGSALKLNQVVDTVAEWLQQRRTQQLAVVVSAQGNTTDWLLDAADFAAGKDT